MHQFRNKKLPESFSNMFLEITDNDDLQTRHNDYNYVNKPALKNFLEKFPTKSMVSNWNHLDIDLKSTSDFTEFKILLKESILSNYSSDPSCHGKCYSCDN